MSETIAKKLIGILLTDTALAEVLVEDDEVRSFGLDINANTDRVRNRNLLLRKLSDQGLLTNEDYTFITRDPMHYEQTLDKIKRLLVTE